MPARPLHVALICLGLALLTLAVYARVAGHDFIHVFDDGTYVVYNEHVHDGITASSVRWAATSLYAWNWHPLTWLSHMLDCALFGLDPAGHHLSSLALHVLNTVLLFLTLRHMTRAAWRSALVAALFAVHPLHVESVAWVAERKDVLSATFWILAMWAYSLYALRPGLLRYALVALALAAGLAAKQMLVTLPCVLLLMDVWPLGRWRPPGSVSDDPDARVPAASAIRLVLEKVPLLAMSAIASVVVVIAQGRAGAIADLEAIPLLARLQNALISYVVYVNKMIWPTDLAVFYPFRHTVPLWMVGGAGVTLIAATVGALATSRRYPYVLVGWLWYVGTLIPVIGLVQVGDQAMADRFTYVPLIGLFIVVVWGIGDLAARRPGARMACGALAVVALIALSVACFRQVGHWRNSITLFEHTLLVTRENHLANNNMGSALIRQDRDVERALGHFREAVRIKPDYTVARSNLGAGLLDLGRVGEALPHLEHAARLAPEDHTNHANLGSAYARSERWDDAARHLQRAVELDPGAIESRARLAEVYVTQGRRADATREYTEIVRLDPAHGTARANLGMLLLDEGRFVEAAEHLMEALRLVPEQADVHYTIGKTMAALGNHVEAAEHLEQAVRIRPTDLEAIVLLGDMYARAGRGAEAAAQYRTVLRQRSRWPSALIGLAWLTATSSDKALRDGPRAVMLAEQACAVTANQHPRALDALAAAYAETGRFDDALRVAGMAIDAAQATEQTDLLPGIQARMESYLDQRPWRE